MNKDTIVAISTPVGQGGIGIVRMSGGDSLKIADMIFSPVKDKRLSECGTHTVHYGYIKDPGSSETVDEVLVTVMRAPMTYTAEDIVEINCHGGVFPLKKVVELCVAQGARLAEPGEFTKRAFLNGRIDLSQAEAVLDVINSRSETVQKLAVGQLKGVFSREVCKLRNRILDILANIELSIDFAEEDVRFETIDKISDEVTVLKRVIEDILKTSEKGIMLRQGVKVVICGKPNVGKSSLMNSLLRHDRMIVTPVSGTTRDVIEEEADISGLPVQLSDTAGITGTRDEVEAEGVKRSKEKISQADIVVFLLDINRPLSEDDLQIYDVIREKKVIVAVNKTDLTHILDISEVRRRFSADKILQISVLKDTGIKDLERSITEAVLEGENVEAAEGPVVANLRHKEALEKALTCIARGEKVSGDDFNAELLASDLNEAVYYLGLITGETVSDEILDRIFSRFCIGK